MKQTKIIFLVILFTTILCLSSCVSTRVEASPHDTNVANLECHKKSNWSYLWGTVQKPVDVNPNTQDVECPCREEAMAWTEVKTSFGDFLLSIVTLGAVNHRTVTYGCARPPSGERDF